MPILTTYEWSLRAQIIFAPAICVVCNVSIHAIEKRSPRARKTLSVKQHKNRKDTKTKTKSSLYRFRYIGLTEAFVGLEIGTRIQRVRLAFKVTFVLVQSTVWLHAYLDIANQFFNA